MPYSRETAAKTSHADIVNNADVQEFLGRCTYLTPPSEAEASAISSRFLVAPDVSRVALPRHVIAVDGSLYESSLSDRVPHTKIGYVKIGAILIRIDEYLGLRVGSGRFVDPFRVARLEENNWSLAFTLPSANVRYGGAVSVRDSFRMALDAQLYGNKTRFRTGDASTSLRSTLFALASRRPGELGTGDESRLRLHRCPSCGRGPIEIRDSEEVAVCPHCESPVYSSDALRIWEEVSDQQSNYGAISRLMSLVEHLLPIHYIRYLHQHAPAMLGTLAFFVDGPLAVFGSAAWLHAAIMRYLHEVKTNLEARGFGSPQIIGLQKSGQVVDHALMIEPYLPENRLLPIDDDYRYSHIIASRDPARNGFGSETYYGQDFIYKTMSGRVFVFGIPYPWTSKGDVPDFVRAKTTLSNYPYLNPALALLHHFETDLYENAVVPIALAHRYTAISLVPGGRVLDILTERALGS